jgi:peptide/nickel transport system permease protein
MTSLTISGSEAAVARSRRPLRLLRRPLAAICLAYLVLVCAASLAAPLIAPYGPTETDLTHVLSGPSGRHLLGTDTLGRDLLSRLLFGGRLSLEGALEATLVFVLIGVPLGLLAGYYGGWLDRVTSWFIDLAFTVPAIVVLLVILAVVGNRPAVAMMALGLLAAPGLARLVRATTLAGREELYVAAARVSGLPDRHIIAKQILPRLFGPIVIRCSLFAGEALIAQTGLDYLGLGSQPPTATWGGMVAEASAAIERQPWMLVPSGVAIGLTVLAFALLGDSVQDAVLGRTSRSGRPPATASAPQRDCDEAVKDGRGDSPATAPHEVQSLLSLHGVCVAVPHSGSWQAVVSDVDLDVAAGETVGLVGESGCGKSVTARAVLRLPNGGRVISGRMIFEGREIAGLADSDMRRVRGSQIALISQEPAGSLDPCRTVGRQLRELVQLHDGLGRQAAGKQVLELLQAVRLPEPDAVARRYPHQLSGGMAQRVCIAMALSGRPKLLIADEPTTALDVTVQAEILDLLRELQRETGMAILLITHDWGVVADTCSRAYVMYAGQVVEASDIGAMVAEPRHPYTAGLLNSAPSRAIKGAEIAAIEGTVPDPADWPVGCRFHPRCPYATAACSAGPIPMLAPAAARVTRCIHHERLAEGSSSALNEPAAARH